MCDTRETFKLPRQMSPSRAVYEAIGFKFYEIDDNLFYDVKLPEGWRIQQKDSHIQNIFDEKGRQRASVLYINAKVGMMTLMPRYSVQSDRDEEKVHIFVRDYDGSTIFDCGCCGIRDNKKQFEYKGAAKKYLNENYPNWHDANMYWD